MIESTIKKIITDYLHVPFELKPGDSMIEDLGCDYTDLIDILNNIEIELKISIVHEEDFKIETVQDLIDSVNKLLISDKRTLH